MEQKSITMPQPLDEWFLSLLACPACTQRHPVHLNEEGTGLVCACGKYRFPVTDGIPVLVIDSAEVINPNADPATVDVAEAGS